MALWRAGDDAFRVGSVLELGTQKAVKEKKAF